MVAVVNRVNRGIRWYILVMWDMWVRKEGKSVVKREEREKKRIGGTSKM